MDAGLSAVVLTRALRHPAPRWIAKAGVCVAAGVLIVVGAAALGVVLVCVSGWVRLLDLEEWIDR